MTLNKKGLALWDRWHKLYHAENDKLGGDSENGYFVDGWCIIDNTDYIKNITDQCGLLIFGYEEDAIYIVEEWIEEWGNEKVNPFDFTWQDVINEMLQYFE